MDPVATLQSPILETIGFAILNSIWQAFILWTLYKAITLTMPKTSALVKYNIGILTLVFNVIWLAATFSIVQFNNYFTRGTILDHSRINILFQRIPSSIFPYLSIIYILFLFYHLWKQVQNYRSVLFLRKSGLQKTPVAIRLLVNSLTQQITPGRKIYVWISEHIQVPVVSGILKPVILLPLAFANQLNTKQMEAVIIHEIAHIRRHDFLINLLQTIIETILYFNPFIRLLNKEIRKERENACDDWVVLYKYSAKDYANALVLLEQHRISLPNFALAATNSKKLLLIRIKRLFADQRRHNELRNSQLASILGISLLFIAAILFFVPTNISKYQQQPALANTSETTYQIAPLDAFYKPVKFTLNENNKIFGLNNRPQISPKTNSFSGKSSGKVLNHISFPTKKDNKPDDAATVAYINEDLFKKEIPAEKIQLVANTEVSNSQHRDIYVKIEEEQSGKNQNNSYIFKLSENNGQATIKPLIILKKKSNVATDDSTLKKVSKKKLITV